MNKERLIEINKEMQSYYGKMNILTNEVVQDIISQIKAEFPDMKVEARTDFGEGGDTWIFVDKEAYKNDKFLELVNKIDTTTLFESGIYTIYIAERM